MSEKQEPDVVAAQQDKNCAEINHALGFLVHSALNEASRQNLVAVSQLQSDITDVARSMQGSLSEFNDMSAAAFEQISGHFDQYTNILKDVRQNLCSVFKRIEVIEKELRRQYPVLETREKKIPCMPEDGQ